jgi:hypothetical protein
VLKLLNLRTSRTSEEMKRISDKMLINDLQRVAKKLNKNIVTSSEYYELGKYSAPTISERFESWSDFLENAGLEQTGFQKRIPDLDLFKEMERIWIQIGRQPTTTDMKKGISKYSLDSFTRRFGGWRNALQKFVEYINSEDDIDDLKSEHQNNDYSKEPDFEDDPQIETSNVEHESIKIKRTPRNINLKLRFKVLQRDNFRCCSCGASPAKDPDVELHVDHILPWSKGGETLIENLQTLCSKCNLGKSNMI